MTADWTAGEIVRVQDAIERVLDERGGGRDVDADTLYALTLTAMSETAALRPSPSAPEGEAGSGVVHRAPTGRYDPFTCCGGEAITMRTADALAWVDSVVTCPGPRVQVGQGITGAVAAKLGVGAVVRWAPDKSEGGLRRHGPDGWHPMISETPGTRYVVVELPPAPAGPAQAEGAGETEDGQP